MFTAECVSHTLEATRQRNDRQADFRCGANPQRGESSWEFRLKIYDPSPVSSLPAIQCTYGEIAATLGVSVDTLQRNKNFAVVYKKGAEGGRKSLRRMQFEAANKGNVTMQIWLGKQYLSQSDHGMLEVRQASSFRDLTPQDLREVLDEYAKKYPELVREISLEAEFSVVEPQPTVRPAALLGE